MDSAPEVDSRNAPIARFPWKSIHYFYEPPVFSAFFTVDLLRELIFGGPRALTVVSARRPMVPESPGVKLAN